MATIFQESVWSALSKIPKGQITTYGEIAKYLGKPKSARAVGTAVGKNPCAPQVPCHRVLPKSGKIGNYSGLGGVATKIKLLEEEGFVVEEGKVLLQADGFYSFGEGLLGLSLGEDRSSRWIV